MTSTNTKNLQESVIVGNVEFLLISLTDNFEDNRLIIVFLVCIGALSVVSP